MPFLSHVSIFAKIDSTERGDMVIANSRSTCFCLRPLSQCAFQSDHSAHPGSRTQTCFSPNQRLAPTHTIRGPTELVSSCTVPFLVLSCFFRMVSNGPHRYGRMESLWILQSLWSCSVHSGTVAVHGRPAAPGGSLKGGFSLWKAC